MVTIFFLEHPAFVPMALLLIALICIGIGFLILCSRRYGHRITWTFLALSSLLVFALTLGPSHNSRPDDVVCSIQLSVPTLTSVELLANVALFVPLAFFATLATRRPLSMLAAGAGLSAAIEVVQAVVPAIGRACDASDWMMNTVGTVVGVLLACATIALASRRAVKDGDRSAAFPPGDSG
jgi:VanZ family protein